MAESKYKGLLYSPEVLGGLGLLTQGLSGAAPNTALPSLMQGIQTASMFRKEQDEEEKRKLIEQYSDQVPEDQKAVFKMFPVEWIKKNKLGTKKNQTIKGADGFNYFVGGEKDGQRVLPGVEKKPEKPNFTTFYKNDGSKITLDLNNQDQIVEANTLLQGEYSLQKPDKFVKPDIITLKSANGDDIKSLNISDKNVMVELESLLKEGYTEFKQNVNATDASGLSKGTKTKVEKGLLGADKLLGALEATQTRFKDEFLTIGGKVRYQKLFLLDKGGMQLNQDDAAYLRSYSVWEQGNLQYFNQYRKEITGVAAGEKEIAWLEASIPSSKDSPTTYRAKMKNQIRIQEELIDKSKKFKATGGKTYEINDDGERVYSEAFGKFLSTKIKPNGEYLDEMLKSYKIDYNYEPSTAIELMNLKFPNQDWEDILEKYLNAKSGKGL
tara:strand:- start:766 stop:2082 length:1317 start_codon:yes stop_codon:yes gene_type:complete